MMRILYLTINLESYNEAFYQKDVITFLQKSHKVFLYGPGFSCFNKSDSLQSILIKCGFKPDLICIGHSWLNDDKNKPINRLPNLLLRNASIPKVMFLNKEYNRLKDKLDYINKNNINLIFTHHHNITFYKKKTLKEFVFWPFGVNQNNFKDYGKEKKWDLLFTGILRNPNPNVPQTNMRITIQKKLFLSLGQIKLIQKPRYWNYKIFWRALTTKPYINYLSDFIFRRKRLKSEDYYTVMNESRICICTLSPINLVGTRYFEAMASKTMVFCQKSSAYYGLFEPKRHCITFKNDLSNFDKKLRYYLENESERKKIVERAYTQILNFHTWEKRIEQFIKVVEEFIF